VKKEKLKESYMDDLSPVIEVGDKHINATYYNDLSGQIGIVNDDGDNIFFKDDGRLPHHIEYLNEAIEELQKAYRTNVKIYKKAIALLKKEQTKFKAKKVKK
jgi:hypothetical protein